MATEENSHDLARGGVSVSENHYYVNDTFNRRAVRVAKTCAAEAVCVIK